MRYDRKSHTFKYTGNLNDNIRKCEKELKSKEDEFKYCEYAYEKAKRNYDHMKSRIFFLKEFLELAKKEMEK